MASEQMANGRPSADKPRDDDFQPPAPVTDATQPGSGRQTPDSLHRLHPTSSNHSNPGGAIPPASHWPEDPTRRSGERNRSRQRSARSGSGQVRTCKKCGEQLTGQFVRALDGTFHLDCFKCRDCGEIVASKFFPADDNNGEGQYPLCETDYFRRLGLLCHQCGGALRGSYITALNRKYHVDHFSCCMCSTVFGAQDSYYEHDSNVYCHFHYSTRFAQRCNGCQTAILKQFVEIFRNGQNQHWHPECYMIHKFWNVRLGQAVDENNPPPEPDNQADKDRIRKDEELMEEKVFRIWSVLSTFEESSAACISDMLLHVSNGSYVDGVVVAKRFISHVEILFKSTDRLDQTVLEQNGKGLSYGREAKLLCKKIVAFFSLLSKTQDNEARKLGVTQELLSLVTGLAHYLKLLIRICLQGALRLEREDQNSLGLNQFLDDLHDFDASKTDEGVLQAAMADVRLSAKDSDQCTLCRRAIEDECAKNGSSRWHLTCVGCSRCGRELGRTLAEARFNGQEGKLYCVKCAPQLDSAMQLEYVSKLQQFIFLLQVALARLLNILSSNGAIPSNPIANVDKNNLITEPPRLTADSRSKSYSPAPAAGNERRESTYENSLNEVRRLRSTRLDRHLSTSVRRARTSKVFDADGRGPRPASPSGDAEPDTQESTDTMFGHNDAITLDDIPRIVAAEQSREKQNQQAGGQPAAPTTRHNRAFSVGKDADFSTPDSVPARITRKFFPELSALEYFNMRLLAVLTMHPLVEQEVSLEELLSFIEARKPATFWKNLGKAFKNDKSKNTKKKGVFGVPLDVIIERDGAESTDGVGPGALRVPAIVDDIVTCMRKMDLSVEGVFRKNGNIKKQLEMVERINAEGCDSVNFMEQPVVQLAALLKRYLRELPDPLMTHKLYGLWTSAAKISDPAKKKQCLHLLCCLLPKSHRDCLEILFTFLKWAGTFHQLDDEGGSKMDVRNLATVIAPNILTNPSKAPALDNEAMFVIEAVEMLITNIEEMCQVPDELLSLLNDPYLFSGPGEVTTKEILKRFQDRRGQVQISDVNEVYNRQDMSSRSPPKRVETDPSLWQAERTVRPINDPAGPNQTMGTPPQLWASSDERPSPYKNSQYTASDSNLSSSGNNQRGDWRNSAWGRQPGGLGVGNS